MFVVSAGIPTVSSASFWSYSPFVRNVIKSKASFASFVSLLIPNTCAPKLFVSIPFAPSVSAGYAKHPQWKSGPVSYTHLLKP